MNILEIIVLTDSLKKTEHFYKEFLGLKIIRQDDASISFQAGKSIITFRKSSKVKPIYHFAFNIPPNLLNEAVTWTSLKMPLLNIEENNVVANYDSWNARAFYFLDNNNNILEFIARDELEKSTEQVFDTNSILSVSEIGVVTEDVPTMVNELHNQYHIPFFAKQPLRDNFAALGDDSGLLIISQKGRPWFPTQEPANAFYLGLKLLVGEEIAELTFDKDPVSHENDA